MRMWEADLNLDLSNPRKACVYPSTGWRRRRSSQQKRKSLSRKGGGVQWKEWHLHHNPTRTSIGILRLDETANDDDSQSTDEATIVVLLDDRDVLRYV